MNSKRCSLLHFLNLLLEAMFAMPERTHIKQSSWLGAITRLFEGLPPTAVYLSQPFTVPNKLLRMDAKLVKEEDHPSPYPSLLFQCSIYLSRVTRATHRSNPPRCHRSIHLQRGKPKGSEGRKAARESAHFDLRSSSKRNRAMCPRTS